MLSKSFMKENIDRKQSFRKLHPSLPIVSNFTFLKEATHSQNAEPAVQHA